MMYCTEYSMSCCIKVHCSWCVQGGRLYLLAMALTIIEDADVAARMFEMWWANKSMLYTIAEANSCAEGIVSSLLTAQALAHRTFFQAEIVLISQSVLAEYPQHAKTAEEMYFMNPNALAKYTLGSDVEPFGATAAAAAGGPLPTTSSSSSSNAVQAPVPVNALSALMGGLKVIGQNEPKEGSILCNQPVSSIAAAADKMLNLVCWESNRCSWHGSWVTLSTCQV